MHEQTGLTWIKASRSLGSGACVELAKVAPFYFTRTEFDAFLHGARHQEFDHLL